MEKWAVGIGAIVAAFALSSSPEWGGIITLFLVLVFVYSVIRYYEQKRG